MKDHFEVFVRNRLGGGAQPEYRALNSGLPVYGFTSTREYLMYMVIDEAKVVRLIKL